MDETTGERADSYRETILLRGMLIVAVGGLLIDAGIARASTAALSLVLVFALSNALLPFLPRRAVRSPRFDLMLGAGDLLLVALGIHIAGAIGGALPISCLLMTLVMALSHHRVSAVAGAAAIGALHAWLLLRTSPEVGIGRQLVLQTLFLCSVGLYYGCMTQRSHRRRRRQSVDQGDRERTTLFEILETTSRTGDLHQAGLSIVGKVAGIVPAVRCSIVQVDRARTRAQVLVSHDNPALDRLGIDLEKYPEIKEALHSRSPVIVQDIMHNPMMAGVRDRLRALEFRSLIVVPLISGGEVMGALCVKAARVNQAFTRREIEFCVAVARATAQMMLNVALDGRCGEDRIFIGHDAAGLTPAQARQWQSEKLSSIAEVLSNVAHELNNPLCGVLGFSQLLLARNASGPLAGDLQKIHISALRCQKIVKDLVSFARSEASERRYLGVNGIIDKTIELTREQLRVDGIEVVRELQLDLPRTMLDFHQMQQVFINLIDNARQAMAQASGRRGRLLVRTSHRDGLIRVEFSDNGCGMSPEVLRKAFDPFFSTRPGERGAGIGLSVAYGIIREHGGEIEARTQVGEGATLLIDLPIVEIGREEPKGDVPAPDSRQPAQGRRVLVVDDEPLVVDLLLSILEDLGHTVDTAQNGVEAFGKIRTESYDLIITDIRMPRMNGMDLYRRLLARRPDLTSRVLFITGDLIDQETARFLRETGARTLAKPVQVAEVVGAVQDLLGSPSTSAVA